MVNNFFKSLKAKSEAGVSLIQIMLLAALVSTGVTFSVLQNSKTSRQISHNVHNQDLRNFVDRIQSVLANQPDCQDIVNGTTGFATLAVNATINPTTLTGSNLGKFLEETNAVTSTPRYGAQEKISLTDISINRTSLEAATLTLTFRIDEDVLGIAEFAKQIPLIILGTAATVTTCHANPDSIVSDAVKRFCHGPGAIYRTETNQCFIIGFANDACDPGEHVKGLSFNASTLMMDPVCSGVTGLTYDTVGCYGTANIPTGFDASGDLVCTPMTSGYVWDLVYLNQQNATYEDCTSRVAKLTMNTGVMAVKCRAATATPTATNTPTETATPTPVGATATPTNTPTNTPTFTPTPATPTPTPTACGLTGQPFSDTLTKAAQTISYTNSVNYVGSGCGDSGVGGVVVQSYFYPPAETTTDADTLTMGAYNVTNLPVEPAAPTVKFCGSSSGTPVCDCTMYVVSNMSLCFGYQVDDPTSPYRMSDCLYGNSYSRVTAYTITNCTMSGNCAAARGAATTCMTGNSLDAAVLNLNRILTGGIHKPEIEGTTYNVCTGTTEESYWTIWAEAATYPPCSSNYGTSTVCDIAEGCGGAPGSLAASCSCSGGSVSGTLKFTYPTPSQMSKTINIPISNYSD